TTFELAARLADLEGGTHCFLTPGGQAAISLIYFAFARAGGHVLLPESAYGPNRDLADRLLAQLGIATEYYDPMIGGEIRTLIRDNTQLIWCESPGSATMEVQDVPAITAAARQAGVVTALDNTYAAGVLFDAFAHGVNVTMQALTKYVGGHSDLLLGSVTVRDPDHYQALGDAHQLLGMGVSPDDCSLALRGMQTLAVRLKQLEDTTLAVARWLAEQPEVELVLHPALPTCPGHEFWQRDFTGSASVFSVVFASDVPADAIIRFVDRLSLFKIGYSWGGVTSLAMPHFDLKRRYRAYGNRLVRFNIGLEVAGDLIADLEQGLSALRA
ncbi:MAG TPA: cystathionine beta-lyase, partial [Ktedonobacterales bacterium]